MGDAIASSCSLGALLLAVIYLCTVYSVGQEHPGKSVELEIAKADALKSAGSPQEARRIYQSLLPQLRSQKPSVDLGKVLGKLSVIENLDGKYDQAVALARESATVYENLHDKTGEARARNDAAFASTNTGNYSAATDDLLLALTLNNQTGDTKAAVLTLNNLGIVYYYQAKYSEAVRTYDTAMQDIDQSIDVEWAPYWKRVTLLNLATLYQRVGNYQRALKIYQELEHSPTNLKPKDLAHLYANLGVLYRHLGDPEKALRAYQSANRLYARERDSDGELGVLKNTGIVLGLDLRRFPAALRIFAKALFLSAKTNNSRETMQVTLYKGEMLYEMGALAQAEQAFRITLALASKLGTLEEKWKALYALGKIAERTGRTGIAEIQFRQAIENIEGLRATLQLSNLKSDFLADKRDVYDALIALVLERKDAATAFEYMERSRARLFQDRFAGREKGSPSPATLHSIQSRLDAKTALVEFWTGSKAIAAIWITKTSTGIAHTQLTSDAFDELLQLASKLPENLDDDWRRTVHKMNTLILNAIDPWSESRYQHLLIVPDGFLSMFPLELASTSAGATLLETHDVTYLPSAALFLREEENHPRQIWFPWQTQVEAFGAPSIAATSEDLMMPRLNINPVVSPSNSEKEIRQIAGMAAGRTKIFLGVADRKQAFFSSAPSSASLLHVSTHAVADMDDPERSRLLFSPNAAGQSNDYVFLKEVYSLDLRGTSLATLSACDTERGRLIPGEGVQAFSRAFLSSGARSTLTTLWRVPDEPTAEFMRHFYFFLLKKHTSKTEALRQTKLTFIRSGTSLSHPRYWAAFVLNGAGAEAVPRFIPWSLVVLPMAIVALALLIYLYAASELWRKNRHRNHRVTSRVRQQP